MTFTCFMCATDPKKTRFSSSVGSTRRTELIHGRKTRFHIRLHEIFMRWRHVVVKRSQKNVGFSLFVQTFWHLTPRTFKSTERKLLHVYQLWIRARSASAWLSSRLTQKTMQSLLLNFKKSSPDTSLHHKSLTNTSDRSLQKKNKHLTPSSDVAGKHPGLCVTFVTAQVSCCHSHISTCVCLYTLVLKVRCVIAILRSTPLKFNLIISIFTISMRW